MTNDKIAKHPAEFKASAVKLALESDKPFAHIDTELGGVSQDPMHTVALFLVLSKNKNIAQ